MRKMIIGLAAGSLALGATAMPASAGAPVDSIWDIIRENNVDLSYAQSNVPSELTAFGFDIYDILTETNTEILEDIILISGYADMLDACGNGKPQFTLFAPLDSVTVPFSLDLPNPYPDAELISLLQDPPFSFSDNEIADFVNDDGDYEIGILQAVLDLLGYSVADLNNLNSVVRGILNDHIANGSFSPWQLDQDEITTITSRSGFTLRNENRGTINDQTILGAERACNGFVYFIAGFIDSTAQVATEGLNALDTPQDGTPGGSNSLPDTL